MRRKKNRTEEAEAVLQNDGASELDENGGETGAGVSTAGPAGTDADRAPEEGRIARLEAERDEWKDRALRALADMENVRRRSRVEAEEARRYANERLVSDLLPVLDNFARALEAADQTRDFDALRSGVELIHRQLTELLERIGVERIEAMGQPFDPNLHEAIMQVEAQEGQEPHQVVEELRAGYRLNDRVVRPSLVKVTAA